MTKINKISFYYVWNLCDGRAWLSWKGGRALWPLSPVTCVAGMLLKKLISWYVQSFSYLLISSYYQCQQVVLYLQNMIKVSELLGSFGDNELSPECLDGAQRFLKSDGISIPSWYVYGQRKQISQHLFCIWSLLIMFICSYTSFIQPITASKLYNDVSISKSTLLHLSCHGWVPNKK